MDPNKLRKILMEESSINKGIQQINNNRRKSKHSNTGGKRGVVEKKDPLNFLHRKRNIFMSKKAKSKCKELNDKVTIDWKVDDDDKKQKSLPKPDTLAVKKPAVKSRKSEVEADTTRRHLQGSQFRFLNELLYTQTSWEAADMFKHDPGAFNIYHEGFESQRRQWPKDPLQRVIKFIQRLPSHSVVADFGCGDARLAATLKDQTVHSFDFMAVNESVTACDMRKTPLKDKSVDIAVFCLSLMGTNCNEFIREANRVLKMKGVLKIVEISSRIQRLTRLVNQIERMGFACIDKAPDDFFIYLTFIKKSTCPSGSLPPIILNPCTYKKR